MSELGIVCIHGAGLNSSIWDDFIKEIKKDVLAIDFPNRKKNDFANKELEFSDYIITTTEQIKNWNKKHFIIVAHSIGACVAFKVAEEFKDELKGIVAIASIIPKSGNSFASTLPFPQNFILPLMLNIMGTKPPKASIKSTLCNDLNKTQTDKIVNEFTPESKKLYTAKINFSLPITINKLYINTTKDKMSETLQNKMAENFEVNKIVSLDSGHLPMLSKSHQLATVILHFAKEIIQDEKTTNREQRLCATLPARLNDRAKFQHLCHNLTNF